MVQVTNGYDIFTVTAGAFEAIFKPQGYEKIEKAVKAKVEEVIDDQFAELLEKPLAQWTKSEVKSYAAANAIDLVGTKSIGEAKALIKKALNV